MRLTFKSNSSFKTKKIASALAKEAARTKPNESLVLALEGNLGSGKTTFTQGFARALGIKENVLSPTFVLMKVYKIGRNPRRQTSNIKGQMFRHLIHIDCYRLDSPKDLLHLGFKNLLKDKDAIILIEWADRIRKLLPRGAIWIRFKHGKKSQERVLKISNYSN